MDKKLKEQILLILIAAGCLLIVMNMTQIFAGITWVLGAMSSIVLGLILAFIFNVPMKHMENQLERLHVPKVLRRTIAIFGVLVILIAIIVAVSWIIVPTLANTVVQLSSSINYVINVAIEWTQSSGILQTADVERITNFINQSNIVSTAVSFLGGFTTNVTGIVSNVFTILMSIFLMLSILSSKEFLKRISMRVFRVLLPDRQVNHIRYVGKVVLDTYDRFLMGQLIEACIIGTLVFAGYSMMGLPYAAITGVLSGVLSFIPYIGPFSACALGAIFIFTVSPIQALVSIVVFQVLQLIEGNFIYPRVVGGTIGLPTVLTLSAALIGGNLFGIVGMIFFTPMFAVVYRLVKELVEKREATLLVRKEQQDASQEVE